MSPLQKVFDLNYLMKEQTVETVCKFRKLLLTVDLSRRLIRENDKYLNNFTCATLVQSFTTFLEWTHLFWAYIFTYSKIWYYLFTKR